MGIGFMELLDHELEI